MVPLSIILIDSWLVFQGRDIYRQDAAKRQTAGVKFTDRPKIRFFVPQGRLVTLFHVKLCRTDGHVSPLGCAKFHLNRHEVMGVRPQNIKNFHFLVKSLPWPISKIFRGFYTPDYPTLVFQISCDSRHRLVVTELLLRNRALVN